MDRAESSRNGTASGIRRRLASGAAPPVRPRRPGPRGILLALVAVLAVAVALVAGTRTFRTFRVLDFGVAWEEGGIRVVQVPPGSSAGRAGLRPGDVIAAVDGIAVGGARDPVRRLLRGGEHELTVVREGSGTVTVTFEAPPLRLDPVYLARTLVAIVGLLLALWAVLGTSRTEAATFLLLAAASLVVAAVPHRVAADSEILRVLHRAAGAAIPFLLVRFFAIFPEGRSAPRGWDAATVLAMALSASTAAVPWARPWWGRVAVALRITFVLALLVAAWLQITRWRGAARVARVRRQIEWTALGMFVGLFPYGALVLLPRWLGIPFEPFSWMAVLPVVALPAGFLAALREYRLWDLEPITRDSVSATLAVVIGGLIFATLDALLFPTVERVGPLRNLLAFGTGVVLVVLLLPVRRRVEGFLDTWLYHGRPAPRWLITSSTRELAETTDPRLLLEKLTGALQEGLEVEPLATYVRSGDRLFLRVTGGDELPRDLPAAVTEEPFPAPAEAAFPGLGYVERVPLERGGTVHGLLHMGLRRGIFPLGREGRELVTALAAQAALGLESARFMDDLKRQAEEYRILHANTRRIIESSAAGILVCDATGRILSANARAASILESRENLLVGHRLGELVALPDHWEPGLPLHAVNAEGETLVEPRRWVVMAVSVLELESGRFDGRVVVLQDVTELRDLQNRLREQERLAALGRLASGLAHEVNTPLTGIASFAQMLGEMTPPDDPRRDLIAKLVEQSFRVSRIVANLHQAMRGVGSEKVVFPLEEVVHGAALEAARSLGEASRVVVESAVEGDSRVQAAPGAVELAVANLVRNALEASPPGSRVEVRVQGEEDRLVVTVDDAGPGVPEELREKVFEPFFTTRSQRGGTGLGLAITRDMIRHQGGGIRLENSPLGGTRAVIWLPRGGSASPS